MSILGKKITKSIFSGGVTYIFSVAISNLLQFYLLINVNEIIRTDLTLTISFTLSVLLNFSLHNKYVFSKNFDFKKLFKFYTTNSADLLIHVLFWNVFEFFYNSPNILIFNALSVILVLMLYPAKYYIYKIIFKN